MVAGPMAAATAFVRSDESEGRRSRSLWRRPRCGGCAVGYGRSYPAGRRQRTVIGRPGTPFPKTRRRPLPLAQLMGHFKSNNDTESCGGPQGAIRIVKLIRHAKSTDAAHGCPALLNGEEAAIGAARTRRILGTPSSIIAGQSGGGCLRQHRWHHEGALRYR